MNESDPDGWQPSSSEVEKLISQHEQWLTSARHEGRHLDLRKAGLKHVDLSRTNLSEGNLADADLTGADLHSAKLKEAVFDRAKLSGAKLTGANLQQARCEKADLRSADLSGADLSKADLRGASMPQANLQRADLRNADLTDANLLRADLTKADLRGAKLEGVKLSLATLAEARFDSENRSALYLLRQEYRHDGERDEERQITYWIELMRLEDAGLVTGLLRLVGYDLTCQFGNRPLRPMQLLLIGVLAFSMFYWVVMEMQIDHSVKFWSGNIWVTAPAEPGTNQPEQARRRLVIGKERSTRLIQGLHFSLLRAFHLGTSKLNIVVWMGRLQSAEYDFSATGFANIVAWVQTVFSLFLLVLFARVWFGRPFG